MEPLLLRIQEAAQLLNVSKWTIYRWIEKGRLRATKIGRGSVRVFRPSVSGLIEGARLDHRNARGGSRSKEARLRNTGQKKKK